MVKKSIGYVKLAWTCERCDGENPGPRQFCNACGAPQPVDIEFHQPVQEVFVTKPEEIAAARAGADVHCPYCDARNPAGATFCGACGGDLKEGAQREAGKIVGAHKSGSALPTICPSCGTRNVAEATECAGCGDGLSPPAASPTRTEKPVKRSKSGLSAPLLIGGVVMCLALAGIAYALFGRSEQTVATVTDVHWTRSLPILMLGESRAEGWADDIPLEAEVGSCREEYRSSQAEPVAGAVEVCGTPYTVDQGSGYGEVVQDCEYQIFDQWCSYTTLEWLVFDTVTTSGSDLAPYWPETQLTADQRLGERDESYQVSLSGPERTYTYTPENAEEFSRFIPGSNWTLDVNAIGGILSIAPER